MAVLVVYMDAILPPRPGSSDAARIGLQPGPQDEQRERSHDRRGERDRMADLRLRADHVVGDEADDEWRESGAKDVEDEEKERGDLPPHLVRRDHLQRSV